MKQSDSIWLKTNMTCGSCVAKIRSRFQTIGIDRGLRFDLTSIDKTIHFKGGDTEREKALMTLRELGYEATVLRPLTELEFSHVSHAENAGTEFSKFKPLILIAVFLLGITALVEINIGSFNSMRAMNVFMGSFFVTFSFFKFLDLNKFADAFSTYDVLGKRSRTYAWAYPFMELGLGVGFILAVQPKVVNSITVLIMLVGIIGVARALKKNQKIQCACLGTVFDLPMTKVTLVENSVMLAMSLFMLVQH